MRRLLLSALFTTRALATTYDGIDDYTGVLCGPETDDLTYSIRVVAMMPTAATPSTFGRAMYSAASSTTSTAYVSFGTPDNKLTPAITHRSGSFFYSAMSSVPANDGQTHIYCGIADGSTIRLLVDGAQVASASMLGAQAATRGLCTIGALRRSSGSISSFWWGDISSVQVFDHVLSASEISQFCAPAPPVDLCATGGPRYGLELLPPCDATHTSGCQLACTPDRQRIPCACSECMQWTPSPNPDVTHYEIQRTSATGQQNITLHVTVDEDGNKTHPSAWCFWKEPNFTPSEPLYSYTIRSCTDSLCGAWSPPIDYAPAPHTVFP